MSAPAASPALPRVLVCMVNYRTPYLALASLASLVPERVRVPGLRVVVADAASGDGSVERIGEGIRSEGWDEWARVAPLARNGGFAYGNNAVLREVLAGPEPPDYVHLLNPDTEVIPGGVEALVAFLESRPEVGIAGSLQERPPGTPQPSAFRFPSVRGEFESGLRLGAVTRLLERYVVAPPAREVAHATDWVTGSSMMVRRAVFEEVGLLDEGYFLYFEELDFCLAAHRAGWPCWHVPESRVIHHEGGATGVASGAARPPRRPDYWFESRRRFFLKNGSALRALAADVALLVGFALWRLRRRIQGKEDRDPPHFLADLWRHSTLRRGFRL